MMFYVNIPNQSAYSQTSSMSKKDKSAGRGGKAQAKVPEQNKAQTAILKNEKEYSKNAGVAGSFNREGQSWKAGETDKVLYRENKSVRFPNLTKRTNDAITLYMPNTGITSQHTPQWAAAELGADIGEAGSRASAGQKTGMWGQAQGFMAQLAGKMKDLGTDLIGQAAGTTELKSS